MRSTAATIRLSPCRCSSAASRRCSTGRVSRGSGRPWPGARGAGLRAAAGAARGAAAGLCLGCAVALLQGSRRRLRLLGARGRLRGHHDGAADGRARPGDAGARRGSRCGHAAHQHRPGRRRGRAPRAGLPAPALAARGRPEHRRCWCRSRASRRNWARSWRGCSARRLSVPARRQRHRRVAGALPARYLRGAPAVRGHRPRAAASRCDSVSQRTVLPTWRKLGLLGRSLKAPPIDASDLARRPCRRCATSAGAAPSDARSA
jgi:hypothetical protein